MRGTEASAGTVGRLFAWLGGALFVASLLYFVYSYAIRFGTAAPASSPEETPGSLLINAALFSLFAGHHSLMARSGAKRAIGRYLPPALERSVYVWVASVLFLATCAWWRPVPGVMWVIPPPWHVAGWAVQAFGVWLTLDAARAIDPLELAGIRQVIGGRTESGLHARGAYGVVRHPIYLGWALVVFGVPEMTGTRFSFALISTLYLVIAIPFEERSLVEAFGNEYVSYQRRVRWRMLPGLY